MEENNNPNYFGILPANVRYDKKLKPMIKILELFGGIGSPRKALINLGINHKCIDYSVRVYI